MIRDAVPEDLPAIETLLRSVELTTAGVSDRLGEFVVAETDGEIVATAALEIYGSGALLRSVAVQPDRRNRGVARALVERLLQRAHRWNVSSVYLLTTTAASYFPRFGFAPIPRSGVDEAVQQSAEFKDGSCETAQAMRLVLADGRRRWP